MALRLVVSDRAAREIGEAFEWYEEQLPGMGAQFVQMLDAQFAAIVQSPVLYAQTQRGVRRALLPRFPYSVFYASKGEVVSILAVVHIARSPLRWPRR